MCCAGIIHWKVFETYIGTEMKKRKSDVFAFIGFSFLLPPSFSAFGTTRAADCVDIVPLRLSFCLEAGRRYYLFYDAQSIRYLVPLFMFRSPEHLELWPVERTDPALPWQRLQDSSYR